MITETLSRFAASFYNNYIDRPEIDVFLADEIHSVGLQA